MAKKDKKPKSAYIREILAMYKEDFDDARTALDRLNQPGLLEKIEDYIDIHEAERVLADPAEKPIPYEQVRKELKLEPLPGSHPAPPIPRSNKPGR